MSEVNYHMNGMNSWMVGEAVYQSIKRWQRRWFGGKTMISDVCSLRYLHFQGGDVYVHTCSCRGLHVYGNKLPRELQGAGREDFHLFYIFQII